MWERERELKCEVASVDSLMSGQNGRYLHVVFGVCACSAPLLLSFLSLFFFLSLFEAWCMSKETKASLEMNDKRPY